MEQPDSESPEPHRHRHKKRHHRRSQAWIPKLLTAAVAIGIIGLCVYLWSLLQ
jgi:hypothetical protein